MLTETVITAKLSSSLRKDSFAMVLNLHGHAMQAAGWPDAYISHWLFHGWIEFKGPTRDVTPLQRKIMRELLKRGDNVFVVRFTNPKMYSLRTAPCESEVIADIYGDYKDAGRELLNEISKYTKLQDSTTEGVHKLVRDGQKDG